MTAEQTRITDLLLKSAITIALFFGGALLNDIRQGQSEERTQRVLMTEKLAKIEQQMSGFAQQSESSSADIRDMQSALNALDHRVTVIESRRKGVAP